MTELIIGSVAGMEGVDQEALDKLGQALVGFMQTTLDKAAAQEKEKDVYKRQGRLYPQTDKLQTPRPWHIHAASFAGRFCRFLTSYALEC